MGTMLSLGSFALASVTLAVATHGCGKDTPPPAPAPASKAAVVKAGQRATVTQTYLDNCSHCHGQNGEGGGAGSRTFLTKALFDQSNDRPFYDAVANGVAGTAMPAYGDALPKPMIWGLVVHIRELQAKALRAEFGSPKPDAQGIYHSQRQNFRIETVVSRTKGINTPWAIDWLPDGRALITSRLGRLVVVEGRELRDVQGIPPVADLGQGGMLDVAVHPSYRSNGWVYLAFSDPNEQGSAMTKIVRGRLRFGDTVRWTTQQTIFEAPADSYSRAGVHFGSRIVFDGNGHLYFSIGERGQAPFAQEPSKPNGKIYRVNEDGSIPKDNPFANTAGALAIIPSTRPGTILSPCGQRLLRRSSVITLEPPSW